MKLLQRLINNKYKNRILDKIRSLEIELLKLKMDRTNLYSKDPSAYSKSLLKQDRLINDIMLLKSLL
jgi:hypothetical protein